MKTRIIDLRKTTTRSLSNPKPNGIDVLEEIEAEEGLYLTQVGDVPIEERVLGRKATLGAGCSSDEWTEINAEQYKQYKAEMEAFAQREAATDEGETPDEE